MRRSRNVLGGPLASCSTQPMTGYYRNGCCDTGPDDAGLHTVCVVCDPAFLGFSQAAGNDLSTPRPEFQFPGLRPGDRWCVCVTRWIEALDAGFGAQIVLEATHEFALEYVSLEVLRAHAIDG